ncbi:MAG: hypothetical protein RIR97_1379 [Pseudomonadota bacterium]
MKIAVLGANGRLAHAVALAALARGHEVIAVTRSGTCDGLEGQVEFRKADALVEGDLIAATAGADVIFNGLNPVYTDWTDKVMVLARNVVAAAVATGAVHLFIGNVYNFGKEISVNMTEDMPFHATTEKGQQRMEMEALFKTAASQSSVKTIVLRAGDFYGTAKGGNWFDQMIAAKLRKGKFTWPGPGHLPHAFAYLPDLAEAFIDLAERSAELGSWTVFHFEGHTLTGDQVKALSEKILGRRLSSGSVPWFIIRMIGWVQPMMRELAKMSYLWFTPHSLSGTKLQTFLGTVRTTPSEIALRQAYRDAGLADV